MQIESVQSSADTLYSKQGLLCNSEGVGWTSQISLQSVHPLWQRFSALIAVRDLWECIEWCVKQPAPDAKARVRVTCCVAAQIGTAYGTA